MTAFEQMNIDELTEYYRTRHLQEITPAPLASTEMDGLGPESGALRQLEETFFRLGPSAVPGDPGPDGAYTWRPVK